MCVFFRARARFFLTGSGGHVIFIILQVSILQLLWYLSFSWFTFLTQKWENTVYHFVGLNSFFACGAYHFPDLSFSRVSFKKKSPAALIIFLGYHFAGFNSYNSGWKNLSFSQVIILQVSFSIIFVSKSLSFFVNHFGGSNFLATKVAFIILQVSFSFNISHI